MVSEFRFHRWPIGDRKQLRENRHDAQFIAEWLEDLQLETLAGLVQYPELASSATAHLFANNDPFQVELFKTIRGNVKTLVSMTDRLIARLGLGGGWVVALAQMYVSLQSRPGTRRHIETLRLFIEWQYRQAKARSVAI